MAEKERYLRMRTEAERLEEEEYNSLSFVEDCLGGAVTKGRKKWRKNKEEGNHTVWDVGVWWNMNGRVGSSSI